MDREVIAQELLRLAKEFATEDALKEYLKEHPGADRSDHSVKKTEKKPQQDKQQDKKPAGRQEFLNADKEVFDDYSAISKIKEIKDQFPDEWPDNHEDQQRLVKTLEDHLTDGKILHPDVMKFVDKHKGTPQKLKTLNKASVASELLKVAKLLKAGELEVDVFGGNRGIGLTFSKELSSPRMTLNDVAREIKSLKNEVDAIVSPLEAPEFKEKKIRRQPDSTAWIEDGKVNMIASFTVLHSHNSREVLEFMKTRPVKMTSRSNLIR